MGNSSCTTSIHILEDDSLLHVFDLYRPFLLDNGRGDEALLWGGKGLCVRGRWWYKLAHVCQRWRNVILGSASYLDISLVCTHGTPVADMLAHSPPLPLAIDYVKKVTDITAKCEEGIILALRQRDRVRGVRLQMPVTNLQRLIAAMDEGYPILEYLHIMLPIEDNSTILTFPEILQAPHLRHLRLKGFALPIRSRLLTTSVGLVTLYLDMAHSSTYFHPNTLLRWISLMPQLEALTVYFFIPNRDVERQLMHTLIIAPITLPNLHRFHFRGVSAYLEALVHQIATPCLKKLEIDFFNQLTFSVPRLLQFINLTEDFKFDSAVFKFFGSEVSVRVFPLVEAEMHAYVITVVCRHLDWQVSSIAQIFNSLSQVFSAVEHLTLVHGVHRRSSEEHNKVDRTEWRELFRPFSNVKTLLVDDELIEELSQYLQLEDEELPLEVLPELQELAYSRRGKIGDAFTAFIDARRNAGRPITLFRR